MPIQRLRLYDVLEILVNWSMRLSDSVLKGCWALYARIETKKPHVSRHIKDVNKADIPRPTIAAPK